jgi:hypothetical protein
MTSSGWLTRFVVLVALAICTAVVAVAPVRYSPDELKETLVEEHGLNAGTFGERHAARALERFRHWRTVLSGDRPAPPSGAADGDAAARLAQSEYGASMTVILWLALYRTCHLVEVLPLVIPFVLVFLVDGLTVRTVRAREFIPHSAGMYGLLLFLLVVVMCATVVAFCLPVAVHPALFTLCPISAAVVIGRAAANYHKHG